MSLYLLWCSFHLSTKIAMFFAIMPNFRLNSFRNNSLVLLWNRRRIVLWPKQTRLTPKDVKCIVLLWKSVSAHLPRSYKHHCLPRLLILLISVSVSQIVSGYCTRKLAKPEPCGLSCISFGPIFIFPLSGASHSGRTL